MRKSLSVIAASAVVAGLALAGPAVQPAAALSPGVHFSADDLSTWQANGVVYAAGQSNGLVLAGGTFSQIRPPEGGTGTAQNRSALAVFDAETGAPSSCQFTIALSGGTPTVRAIATAPAPNSDLVYIAGNFSSVSNANGTVNAARVAALNMRTCRVDTTFRVPSISSTVRALAVTGSAVYFAGDFQSVSGQQRLRFAAANRTTGALLPWVADADLPGRAVAVSPDGSKVAIGGDFTTVNGQATHSIAVVDGSTGATLRNYTNNFIPATSVTKAIVSDGAGFYVGNEGTGGGVFDGSLKIDWTTLNQVWRNTCLGATQAILPYKGTLYEAHHRHHCIGINAFQDGKRNFFTAASAEDTHLLGWFPQANDGIGEGIGPRALTVATGRTTGKDYLWAGGEFTRINGQAQQSLTRFGPDDSGNPPTPAPTAETMSNGQIQVRFRTVVDTDDSELTYEIFRNGTLAGSVKSTSFWWTRPQVTWVDPNPGTGSNSYRVRASDGLNASAQSAATASVRAATGRTDYASQVMADGAKLYWRYDEATGVWAHDKSGATTDGMNGLYENGVGRGASGAIAGDTSPAAQLDGVDDYLWEDQYEPAPTTYTVETWFKTDTTTGGKIIGYGNNRPRTDTGAAVISSNYDRHIYMDNTGGVTFGVYNNGTRTIRGAGPYNDNQWHHVVATQGANGMVMYIDGVRVGQHSNTQAQAYYGTWRVGYDSVNSWPNRPTSQYFKGAIDETAVYDTVLSSQQVARHFQLSGRSASTNTRPADAYGAAVFDAEPDLYWRLDETSGTTANDSSVFGTGDGVYGAGVQLDQPALVSGGRAVGTTGAQDSIIAEGRTGSALPQYSQEAWFQTGSTAGGKIIGFENSATGNGSNYDKQLYMTNSGNLVFGVYTGSVQIVRSPQAYNDNQKHHVVATQDATGMKLYVDGALVAQNDVSANQSFDGLWRAGGGNVSGWPEAPSSFYFAGTLDEVAIYSRALPAAEVGAHYRLTTTGPDTVAPSVPQNPTAAVRDGAAVVSWDASSDAVGVAGYRVYRGTTAEFTPSGENLLTTTGDTTITDSTIGVGTYHYRVVAFDVAGNASQASVVASVSASDAAVPSTPQAVTTSVSGQTATVSWAQSTDNVGVAGYTVYRGTSSGFSADAASKIADVTGTEYADSGLAAGTYYYRVAASDAAGNVSAASDSASARVVATVPDPVTVTATPTQDAMVVAAAAGTNYGTNTQLSSRGNTGTTALETYLTFDLPAAPDGMVLTEASLRVRTSTDPTAGSADTHLLRLLTANWNESTVTWNNRPTSFGAQLGQLSGATATSTNYTVNLDAAALRGLAGQSASIAVTAPTGSDNVRFWSSNSATASFRPLLTLTYQAE